MNSLLVVGLTLAPSGALAHNPQIQIGIEAGRIITRGLFPDGPYQSSTPSQRVYQIPLAQRNLGDANDGWYAEPNHVTYPLAGPGVALLDGHFAAASALKVSYIQGLKLWNGSVFVDPGSEQFAASTSAAFGGSILTSDSPPFGSLSLSAVGPVADEHKTIRWRLLGDGAAPNTASDDGIYLLSLQLSTNQAGISASLPYYFLLSKNASTGDAAAALAYVNTHFVPEPATAGLMACAFFVIGSRRRRDA